MQIECAHCEGHGFSSHVRCIHCMGKGHVRSDHRCKCGRAAIKLHKGKLLCYAKVCFEEADKPAIVTGYGYGPAGPMACGYPRSGGFSGTFSGEMDETEAAFFRDRYNNSD